MVFTFLAHYKRPDLSSCCDAASKARVSGLLFSPFVDRLPLVMKKRMICMTHPFLVFPHYFSPLSDLIRMLRSNACVRHPTNVFFFLFSIFHIVFLFVCFFWRKHFFFLVATLPPLHHRVALFSFSPNSATSREFPLNSLASLRYGIRHML